MPSNNPIYDFLVANNLTTKDQASFEKEYSDPAKAQQLYKFFQENSLTTKKYDEFYGTYFGGASKKKDFSLAPTDAQKSQLPYLYGSQNGGALYGSGGESNSEAPSSSIDASDPVKSVLHPLRQQYQQAQADYSPFRNRAVSDATVNKVLPVELSNQTANEVNNKQIAEKQSLYTLNAAHNVIKNQLGDVKIARQALDKIKQQNNGVIPKDNETAQFAEESVKDYNNLSQDILGGKSIKQAAIEEAVKDNPEFANYYKTLNGKIPKSYEGKLVTSYLARHGQNVQNFVEEHPEYKSEFNDLTKDFAKNYPETMAAQVGSEVSQAYENQSKSAADFNTEGFNKKVDDIANELYKGDPQKLAIYNQYVKDNKKDYFKSAAAANAFGGQVLSGLNETMNSLRSVTGMRDSKERAFDVLDKQGKYVHVQPKGIRDWISEGSGFMGMITQIGALGNVAGGLGAAAEGTKAVPAITRFYDEQLRDEEGRLGDNWKAKLGAGIKTGMFAFAPNAIPTGKIQGAIDNLLKDVSEKTAVESVRARVSNAVTEALKQYGKGIGEMTAIKLGEQITDAALGKPHEGADEELYQTAKSMAMGNVLPSLMHGIGAYAGSKVEEPIKTEENGQPTDITTPTTDKTGAEVRDTKDEQTGVNTTDNGLQDGNSGGGKDVGGKGVEVGDKVKTPFGEGEVSRITTKGMPMVKLGDGREIMYTPKMWGDEVTESKLSETSSNEEPKTLSEIVKRHDESNNSTFDDLVNDVEAFGSQSGNQKIQDAVEKYRKEQQEDQKLSGRGDMDTAESELMKVVNEEIKNETSNTISTGKEDVGGEKVDDSESRSSKINKEIDNYEKLGYKVSFKHDDGDYVELHKRIEEPKKDIGEYETQKIGETIRIGIGDDGKIWKSKADYNYSGGGLSGQAGKPKHFWMGNDEPITELENKPTNEIPIPSKEESNTIKEPNTDSQGAEEGKGKPKEEFIQPIEPTNEGQPPTEKPPVEEGGGGKDENVSGITHAETAKTREKLGLPEYEGLEKSSHPKLIEEAKQAIADNPNAANEVMDKYKAGGKMTDKDNAILSEYKSALDYQLENKPSKEIFDKLNELIKVLEPSGSEAGKLLESRKLLSAQQDNLGNFLLGKQEAQGAPLTEKQFKEETAKYQELKKERDALADQLAKEREQHAKDIAELGFNKAKAKAKKASKKSSDEYKAERKKSVDAAKEALKKIRESGKLNSTIPLAAELKAIAPHVKDYLQSLLDQGVDKLDNAITELHAEFKDVLEGLTKSHIVEILAGEHDTKGEQTRNQKANAARLLQREAKLLKELADARKGEENAKTTAQQVSSSRRIEELKEKIREVRRLNKENGIDESPDDKAIGEGEANDKLEKKLLARVKKLQDDIKNKRYLEEKPQAKPFTKSRKAQILEDRVIDLENKIRHERSVDQYNKRGKARKAFDKVMEVLGIRRLVQSAVDISVPFRQGATLLSPRHIDVWLKAFGANLRSVFSPKKFERIMYDIRHDPQYHDMVKDRIVYNDLGSADPNLHNEDFRKSFIYKIPVISEPLLASNRSADAFLNVARYEMYKKLRARLESQGLTRESDPQAFKYIGNWVMSMTGRGRMTNMLENSVAHTVLGNTFYGARLMASRFNMLNPVTYFDPRVPKEAKREAMKDIAAWVGTTMMIGTALAATTGAKVSLNPDDGDFLQLRYGKKVYDISGGLVTYIRTFLRLAKAGYTRASGTKYEGKKATENAGQSVVNFFRNKLSPNTSYATDAFFGKAYGQPFDPYDILKVYPMYSDDAYKALKEDGLISLATVLLPNIVGIGYGSYASKGQIDANLDDLLKRNLRSDEMNNTKIFNYNEGGRPVTFKEFNEYADKRDEEIKADLEELYKNGIDGKPYDKLTQQELADEVKYIKDHATQHVKEVMFGKEIKTREEKQKEKELSEARKNLYK